MKILVLNGPNLGRLDLRDKSIYGDLDFPALARLISTEASTAGFEAVVRQSDSESEIISWLHEAADSSTPVIFNPAAFTHYSHAIGDACAMLRAPMLEVHLSNPLAREEFRHISVVAPYAAGTIAGFGPSSYLLAIAALKGLLGL